jgi:hypothetical protein
MGRAVTTPPLARIDGARAPRLHHPHPTLVAPRRTRSPIRESHGEAAWMFGCTPMRFRHAAYSMVVRPKRSEPFAPIYIVLLFNDPVAAHQV